MKAVLKKWELPPLFREIQENHKLDLVDKIFNVVSNDGRHDKKVMFAYTNSEIEAKIIEKKLIDYRNENMPKDTSAPDFLARIIDFYNNTTWCVAYTNKDLEHSFYPKINDKIDNGDRELDNSDITKG